MNLKNLKEFEDELYINLKKLKVDDACGCLNYIIHLIKNFNKSDNLETLFKDKLEPLLDKNTDEVIDIICNFFNIKRTYGFSFNNDRLHINTENDVSDENDENYLRIHISNKLRKIRSSSVKNGNSKKGNKISRIKWNDLACSLKSTNSFRKMNIPCSTFMEKGFCMDGDTCKFTHGKAALVKPKVVHLNSMYNTTAATCDSSSFILPQQDDYYAQLHGLSSVQDDAISISSADSGPLDVSYSPPKIYTAPSLLDSPLWYKELGLVVEDSDSDSSVEIKKRKKKNCLLVLDIPPELNRIGVLNKHFRKFGTLRNIEVKFKGDPKRALVEFRLVKDMESADRNVDAIMGNRFIKTRPYKKCKSNRKLKRHNSRHRSKKSRGILRYSRSASRESRYREDRKDGKDQFGRDIRRRGDRTRRSGYCRQSKSRSANHYRRSKDRSSQSKQRSSIEKSSSPVTPVAVVVIPQELPIKQEMVHVESMHPVVVETPLVMECEYATREHAVPAFQHHTSPCPIATPDIDLKLEKALNDSDVDSIDSDDSLIQRRRVVVDQRRAKLRNENMKNSAHSKLQRVRDSMAHYKSLLEQLIADFKTSDKIKKAILVPRIKDNHARFIQLKELQAQLARCHRDPVEAQITSLQSSLLDQLTVTHKDMDVAVSSHMDTTSSDTNTAGIGTTGTASATSIFVSVPSTIVLYLAMIQADIGDHLPIRNFVMAGYSDTHVLYTVTMDSHQDACQALDILSNKAGGDWSLSLQPPAM